MHGIYNMFRIEPQRIGVVIDAHGTDASIYALPVADLMERIFELAGCAAQPSAGGLITRQLITQLEGLRGAAVFKIPGVRRLLKTYGPTDPFTAKAALQLIGGKDPDNSGAKFSDHENLYIEARPMGTKLTAKDTFTYLVAKGLFRMGAELNCPHCRMTSWIALDALKQRVTCDKCGRDFDATRQLVNGQCHYRRSGLLGAERNAQGAVPVALALQQLDINLAHGRSDHLYATSLDLKPLQGDTPPKCEIDFIWLVSRGTPEKTTIILGECKGSRPRRQCRRKDDHRHRHRKPQSHCGCTTGQALRGVHSSRQIVSLHGAEIAGARTLNDRWRKRVILLTDRELEPWRLYERTKAALNMDLHGGNAERLAHETAAIYFPELAPAPAEPQTRT